MKITLGKLLNIKTALEKLLNADLSIKVSFPLKRLVRAVNEALSHFEDERVALVKKYGTKDDKGNINVDPENVDTFTKQLNELLSVDVELQFVPISHDTLGDLKISAVEMDALDSFVV